MREIPTERLKKYGIFTLPENLSKADIEELRVEQAVSIYKCEFWDNAPYEKIDSQLGANYVFDMAVLHGEKQAIQILQRALWAAHQRKNCVMDDGILGEVTILGINSFSFGKNILQAVLMSALMAERAGFMRLLCVENPKNKEFLDGWLERVYRI